MGRLGNSDVVIKIATEYAGKALEQANKAVGSMGDSFKSAAEKIVNFKTISLAAAAAAAGLGYELYKATQAAIAAEAAEAKLNATLASTQGVAGMTRSALMELAAEMQRTTAFEADMVVEAESLMLTFTKVNKEVFPSAIRLAADMSVGMGQDLKSSIIQVGKALNDPMQGLMALSRVGVQFSDVQKQQIENFMAVNDIASAQKIILGELTTQFGGQAVAQAETYGGKIIQVKNAFEDLQEEIGFLITKNTFFTRSLDLLKQHLERAAQWVQNNRVELMNLVRNGMIRFVEATGWAVEALRFFHNGWLGLKFVGQAVSLALVETVNTVYRALRFLLLPLDLIYQGMQKLGIVQVNPFDAAQKAVNEYREIVLSVGADVLTDIESTNEKYDAVRNTIKGIVNEMRGWKAEQSEIKNTVPPPPSSSPSPSGAPGTGSTGAAGAGNGKTIKEQMEEKLKQLETNGAPQILGKMGAPQEFGESIQLASRLNEVEVYYEKRIELMEKLGRSEAEINEVKNQQILDQDQQLSLLRQALYQGTFAMMSNTMQNLTVLIGKEGGAAFKAMKAFAIAETTIQTYRAAQGAYAALAPIPVVGPVLAIAAATAATIAGLARVKQIAAMEPGGSATGATISAGGTANPSYSGGSPSAYPAATRTEEKQRPSLTIVIEHAELMGDDAMDKFALRLSERVEKYDVKLVASRTV